MTQKERLLNYFLKNSNTITPLEAWTELGIYRLSDTIYRLRKEGHEITTNKCIVKNKFGEDCEVGQYVYEVENCTA